MCGIAGLISENKASLARVLSVMVGCQRHRGPDDEGVEVLDAGHFGVGLGQRRLSILDLSPAGHQPMVSPRTGSVLTYNGELYNFAPLREKLQKLGHSFRGHSDTEVILYALDEWGPECVREFNGMFAFGYYRPRERTLLLARDAMGIKPLYYTQRHGVLAFASEIRPLVAAGLVPRDINMAAVAGLLAYGAVQEPYTFYKDAVNFRAGCYQEFALTPGGKIEAGPLTRHWDFPALDDRWTEASAVEQIRETLDAAVRDHMVSDVPVGMFLSSGLDSTILTGLAAKHTDRLRTFTVGFADQPDMSESVPAARTAELMNVDHTDIQITGKDALESTLAWLEIRDQPSFDGLNTYVISKAVRERGIVVAQSGLGGDELFGGYSSFEDTPRILRTMDRLSWMPGRARYSLFKFIAKLRHRAAGEKLADIGKGQARPMRVALLRRRAISDMRLERMGLLAHDLGLDETYVPQPAIRAALEMNQGDDDRDIIAAVSRYESQFYMRNILLRDSDKLGMASSLEIRVPMLDRRMLDLAFSIPGPVRLPTGRANKHLLRKAFPEFLRPELQAQVKRGFSLPIGRWMAGPLRELCEGALQEVKAREIVRPHKVDVVWKTFLKAPDDPMWSRAFVLCVLGVYLRNADRAAAEVPAQPRPALVG